MDVFHPTYCSNSSFHEDKVGSEAMEPENDDLVTILFSKDKMAIEKAGEHVFGVSGVVPVVPEVEFLDPTQAPTLDPDASKKDIFGNYLPAYRAEIDTSEKAVAVDNDLHRKIPRSARISASEIDTAQIPTGDEYVSVAVGDKLGDVQRTQGGLIMDTGLQSVKEEIVVHNSAPQPGEDGPSLSALLG